MSEKISWLKSGHTYTRVEGEYDTVDKLPVGVYNIYYIPMMGWRVEKYADAFIFDYKVYGLQTDFIKYVIKTYQETTGNMGILLNGVRGSGKTVTAKLLANLLNLPIVIVKDMGEHNQDMIEYLSSFNFDCVLFFDEFEKNFSEKDSTILQIMDGVYNIGYRKIFLLTTNELSVNENLLDRPSRVRYIKQFDNLDIEVVKEYLEDNLKDKANLNELLEFVDTLKISTIDILKAIVVEVNIHGVESFKKAKKFFNVSTSSYDYVTIQGYVERDELKDLKDKKGDLIKLYAKQVNNMRNPMTVPSIKDRSNMTPEEEKAWNEYCEYARKDFSGMHRSYITSDMKIKNLKVGDYFNDEEIIQIDTKKNIIVTDYEGSVYFYQILNPESKPSLYSGVDRYGFYSDVF